MKLYAGYNMEHHQIVTTIPLFYLTHFLLKFLFNALEKMAVIHYAFLKIAM